MQTDYSALREHYRASNCFALDEHRLLELLLSFVVPEVDIEPLTRRLLRQFGTFANVARATPTAMMHHRGASNDMCCLLKLVGAAVDTMLRPRRDRRWRLTDLARVKVYVGRWLPIPAGQIRVLFLDKDYRLIADETLANTYSREVVGRALLLNARRLVLIGRDNGTFRAIDDLAITLGMNVVGVMREGPRLHPDIEAALRLRHHSRHWHRDQTAHRLR